MAQIHEELVIKITNTATVYRLGHQLQWDEQIWDWYMGGSCCVENYGPSEIET